MLSCSTCGRPFHIDETPTPPFCSERCQLIDLGRWLDEDISVPHEGGNSDHHQTGRQNDNDDDDNNDNNDSDSENNWSANG